MTNRAKYARILDELLNGETSIADIFNATNDESSGLEEVRATIGAIDSYQKLGSKEIIEVIKREVDRHVD